MLKRREIVSNLAEQGERERADVVTRLANTLRRPKRDSEQDEVFARKRERLRRDLEVLEQEMDLMFAELQVKREQIYKQIAETEQHMAAEKVRFEAMTDAHRQRMHQSMGVFDELNAKLRKIDIHHIERLHKMNLHLRWMMEQELSDQ